MLISERITNISKLMLVEGTFAEIYSYSDARKLFFDLISFEKRAILIVRATASVGYDLSKMNVEINKEEKKVILKYIPEEEIIVEPHIQYFDLQESTFNEFTKDDLNKMNDEAINQIKKQIKNSVLIPNARERLDEIILNLEQFTQEIGWKFENEMKEPVFNPIEKYWR